MKNDNVQNTTILAENLNNQLKEQVWHNFTNEINNTIHRHIKKVHFFGTSLNASCWVIDPPLAGLIVDFVDELAKVRKRYGLGLMAFTTGKTYFF